VFRRFLLLPPFLLALLIAVPTAANAAQVARVPASFTFTGSGFGHGVGLSQIGAKGQALEGKSAPEILSYYFPSASVTPVLDSQTIRVNIGHEQSNASFSLAPGFVNETMTATDDSGTITLGSTFGFSILGKVITSSSGGSAGLWTLNWNGAVVMRLGSATMTLKYGQIQLRSVPLTGHGYRIEITDTMRVQDEYLYGVSEVRSSWPTEALKTQVIASRTYALARLGAPRKACDCNVYSSIYDQTYIGYAKEAEPTYGALWKSAVDATVIDDSHALAVTFNNQPINVYFFSSSGGMTQRSQDVWGSAFPYLINVPDPWSLSDSLNPGYAHWSRTVTQSQMAAAFGLPDVAKYAISGRTSTGSVVAVVAYSSTGQRSKLSVGDFKTRVKLPSSWFNLPKSVTVPQPTSPVVDTATETSTAH